MCMSSKKGPLNTAKNTYARKQDVDQLWKVVRALISAERREHEAIRRRFEAIRVKVYKESKRTWSQAEGTQSEGQQVFDQPQKLPQDQQPNQLQDRYQEWLKNHKQKEV